MALIKSTLASKLEVLFDPAKPASAADAASQWANAYTAYAAAAMSAASSFPVNASGNVGILNGAFSSAFNAQSVAGAASAIASGVQAFWQAIVWVGATASGATISPGNFSLSAELQTIFSELGSGTAGDKARQIADAFDTGAKQVMTSEVPYVQPAPPIVGPIN